MLEILLLKIIGVCFLLFIDLKLLLDLFKNINMKRICLACDLKDDDALIAEYKKHHSAGNVWPEITKSIVDSGILDMQIFNIGNRLFMIMDVDDSYDPDKKMKMDAENPRIQEWENFMMKFQKLLPWSKNGQKWMEMDRIYKLGE